MTETGVNPHCLDVPNMHWRHRNLPVVSIDYKFDGDGFRMEKDSEGRLELTYAKGVDELSRHPSYLFKVSFQRIESLGNFRKRHKGERMASGSLTICTTDGANTHSRTAYLYRRSDDTCYVVIGDWVYVKEYWDSRTWFPPRKIQMSVTDKKVSGLLRTDDDLCAGPAHGEEARGVPVGKPEASV